MRDYQESNTEALERSVSSSYCSDDEILDDDSDKDKHRSSQKKSQFFEEPQQTLEE